MEVGNYIVDFNVEPLSIILIVAIILLVLWIFYIVLSEETRTKIENWIGQGFWIGFGLTLYSVVCFLITFFVLYLFFR